MNQTYRLVWSLTQQAWVVAGELAKANKKSSLKTCSMAVLLAGAAFGGQAVAGPALNTLPTGEMVVSGRATFDRSVDKQLTINQSTNKLITNWNSFDVGSAAKVNFVQPNTNSIALNRITSGSPTEVFGQVTANGRLVLVNPNGITFGGRSQVSANALIASVLDIQDTDFNNSTLRFSRGNAAGSIENRGKLTATAGSVSLLAPTVKNSGSITVTRGDVNLINADAVQLNSVTPPVVTASTVAGLIQQSGNITATQVSGVGGKILLTGDKSQLSSQVQLSGALQAAQTDVNGRSILVNGNLNLNGDNNTLALTSTDDYSLSNTAAVNLNGAASGFSVNGTAYNVIRDLNQLQAINKKLDGKYVLANNIDASATASWNNGEGFKPIGSDSASFHGVLDGLGHHVEGLVINRPAMNYVGLIRSAGNSKLQNIELTNVQISGKDYTGGLVGTIAENSQIDNSYISGRISGADQVGGLAGGNIGSRINNSYVNAQVKGSNNVGGLVGVNAQWSVLSNNHSGGRVTGINNIGGLVGSSSLFNRIYSSYTVSEVIGSSAVGGLVGNGDYGSTISFSYALGPVKGTSNVGGVVGYSYYTFVDNSYSIGSVSGLSNVGGLVGYSYFRSYLSNSYATGNVTGGSNVGGLIGYNHFDSGIRDSYATGNVTGTSTVGGLVGYNDGSSVSTSYASGHVTGSSDVGALIGRNNTLEFYGFEGLLQNSYWSTQTSGQSVAVGVNAGTIKKLTGLNSTQFKNLASFANWGNSIDAQGGTGSAWRIYEGQTAPLLRSFLKPVDVVINNKIKTYDGQTFKGGSYSLSDPAAILEGSLSYAGNAQGARNAGTYTISGNGLYSGQQGYDIRIVDGSLTIDKKALTISAVQDNKVYDGKLTSAAKPLVTGLVDGDYIVLLKQAYSDKNVGTGKTVHVDGGYLIRDKNNGDNYAVTVLDNTSSVITPKALTISTVANSKVYNGNVSAAAKPLLTGLVAGDSVSGLFEQYETKEVGTGKKLLVKAGYVVNDGNGGNNYTVTEQTSNNGVITAH